LIAAFSWLAISRLSFYHLGVFSFIHELLCFLDGAAETILILIEFSMSSYEASLVDHALHLMELVLLDKNFGLFDLNECTIEVLEEQSVFLNDASWRHIFVDISFVLFFYLVDSNEVNQSVDSVLVINSLALRLDNAVLLFGACDHPLQVFKRHFVILG
jgi:hypothetical protein